MLFKASGYTKVEIALAIIIVSAFLAAPALAVLQLHPLYGCDLVKRKAWPEHHHFDISKDEDDSQTLFALVKHFGTTATSVRVVFFIGMYDEATRGYLAYDELRTSDQPINPGEEIVLSADFTNPDPGKYLVMAVVEYYVPAIWQQGLKQKVFRFRVVP